MFKTQNWFLIFVGTQAMEAVCTTLDNSLWDMYLVSNAWLHVQQAGDKGWDWLQRIGGLEAPRK